jgi:hypothetical protein
MVTTRRAVLRWTRSAGRRASSRHTAIDASTNATEAVWLDPHRRAEARGRVML